MRQQLSIHGFDKSGNPGKGRSGGGLVSEPTPTVFGDKTYTSRRAAARASREAGNTGGAQKGKKH